MARIQMLGTLILFGRVAVAFQQGTVIVNDGVRTKKLEVVTATAGEWAARVVNAEIGNWNGSGLEIMCEGDELKGPNTPCLQVRNGARPTFRVSNSGHIAINTGVFEPAIITVRTTNKDHALRILDQNGRPVFVIDELGNPYVRGGLIGANSGRDGTDGVDGKNGSNGVDGKDGKVGVTTVTTKARTYAGSTDLECDDGYKVLVASCNAGVGIVINGSGSVLGGTYTSWLTPSAENATGVHCQIAAGGSTQALVRCAK